jgi:hypothetical protein
MKKTLLQLSLLGILGILAFGIVGSIPNACGDSSCEPSVISTYSGHGWASEPFDGNDAPFKAIRRGIDALAAKGDDMTALANTYKETAQKKPDDAQAIFRWAYAAFLASHYERYIFIREGILCGVYPAMGQPKNPRSFEYTRLHFFIARLTSSYGQYKDMTELGVRLFRHASKDDFDLRYFGINSVGATASLKNPEPLETALPLVLELQKDFPKRVEPICMLGGIYSSLFAITKQASYADKSLQYFRQYLQVVPDDYIQWRIDAENAIKRVESQKERYKQRGELKP